MMSQTIINAYTGDIPDELSQSVVQMFISLMMNDGAYNVSIEAQDGRPMLIVSGPAEPPEVQALSEADEIAVEQVFRYEDTSGVVSYLAPVVDEEDGQ